MGAEKLDQAKVRTRRRLGADNRSDRIGILVTGYWLMAGFPFGSRLRNRFAFFLITVWVFSDNRIGYDFRAPAHTAKYLIRLGNRLFSMDFFVASSLMPPIVALLKKFFEQRIYRFTLILASSIYQTLNGTRIDW